jgi:hypothetical protein
MRYARLGALLAILAAVVFAVRASASLPKPYTLEGAAPSIDVLVSQLVDALESGDKEAVNRCLITKQDYVDFVLPGAGKPGTPPRHYDDRMNDYAWGTMYGKTIYFRANLIDSMRGKHYTVKDYHFRKGVNDYAWYRAHEQISILLVDDSGSEKPLNTGSILEVNGRYKFISLVND